MARPGPVQRAFTIVYLTAATCMAALGFATMLAGLALLVYGAPN